MDDLRLITLFRTDDHEGSSEGTVKARVRARVMTTIAASSEVTEHSARVTRHPRRVSTGRLASGSRLGIAAMIGALAIALVVPVVLTSGSAANASEALLRLAAAANTGSGWESPTSGQFIYTRSAGRAPVCDGGSCELQAFARESWIAPDGSGRVLQTTGDQRSDETFKAGQLAFQDLNESLGWSSGRLHRHIEDVAGVDRADDFTTFVLIARLMGETQLLPEARSALFELSASLPDTEPLGAMTDTRGRSGIGIGYAKAGIRYEVIYDAETALVLEERTVTTSDAGEATPLRVAPGTWIVPGSRRTYEASGLVGSVTDRL